MCPNRLSNVSEKHEMMVLRKVSTKQIQPSTWLLCGKQNCILVLHENIVTLRKVQQNRYMDQLTFQVFASGEAAIKKRFDTFSQFIWGFVTSSVSSFHWNSLM